MKKKLILFNSNLVKKLQPIKGFGVAKVVDSRHTNFKKGDFIWGMTGWEEYSFISETEQVSKIEHTDDVPLSYYAGLLGKFLWHDEFFLIDFRTNDYDYCN